MSWIFGGKKQSKRQKEGSTLQDRINSLRKQIEINTQGLDLQIKLSEQHHQRALELAKAKKMTEAKQQLQQKKFCEKNSEQYRHLINHYYGLMNDIKMSQQMSELSKETESVLKAINTAKVDGVKFTEMGENLRSKMDEVDLAFDIIKDSNEDKMGDVDEELDELLAMAEEDKKAETEKKKIGAKTEIDDELNKLMVEALGEPVKENENAEAILEMQLKNLEQEHEGKLKEQSTDKKSEKDEQMEKIKNFISS